MAAGTIILLPASPTADEPFVHWWRVEDGALVDTGAGAEWLEHPDVGVGGNLVAIAPASAVRCDVAPAQGSADRQALGIARSQALSGAMADPATLHAVSGFLETGAEDPERHTISAVVANGVMLEWLDWLEKLRADPRAITPSALLLPHGNDWQSAAVGSERLLGRAGVVVPDEPALRSALVGDQQVEEVPQVEIEKRLVKLASTDALNLRSGRFARRRLWVLDRARLRELALLAALIPLIGLLMAIVSIARLNSDTGRLDAETARLVSTFVGRQVAAEAAEAAVSARLASQPGSAGSPFAPLAAVYQQLQLMPNVGAATFSWNADGTLSVTLAAPRADDLNKVLIGLQAAGYRITAVPRQGTDGRSMADVTVRSRP